jgi:hypothetical protein
MSLRRYMRIIFYSMAVITMVVAYLDLAMSGLGSASPDTPDWAHPSDIAAKRVSDIPGEQHEPVLFNNLDCSLITYRLVAESAMRGGCFTETAFGLFSSDSNHVIFNGTDEGLPLLPYTSGQILAPWPRAGDLLAITPQAVAGASVSLYTYPLSAMEDQRNALGQLIAKQLTKPADFSLKAPDGSLLIINAQTLAFSDGGSWLVAEDLNGSFVRINLASLQVLPFSPSYGSAGSPGLLKSRLAISRDGHFVAIYNQSADELKVYDLQGCDLSPVANLQPKACPSFDYMPYLRQKVSNITRLKHLRFLNQTTLSIEVTASSPNDSGVYALAPEGSIDHLSDYLALGDSYTSGEGAFDYAYGTDSPENRCHLSRNSYPLLLTHGVFSPAGGHSVACSGAVINDITDLKDTYKGQARDGYTLNDLRQSHLDLLSSIRASFAPGYLAQGWFVQEYQPRIVTVSVGGNDAGFGDLVQTCVVPHISRHLSDSTCYNTYEDRLEIKNTIDRVVPRWTSLYRQLAAMSPASQIYAIGYPDLVDDQGDCALNVNLNKSELEFSKELVEYLNSDIEKAAEAANVTYIDIGKALAGHRLCETASFNVAVNGLTAGDDAGPLSIKVLGRESYHPNALGHYLIEQEILRRTHNFTSVPLPLGPGSIAADFLNVPRSGRQVVNRSYADMSASGVLPKGSSASLSIDGSASGLQAGHTYQVHLDGPDGTVIGSVTTGADGSGGGSVTMPSDTSDGGHTIDLSGDGQDGNPIDVQQPVYVPDTPDDGDGDGINDVSDSCVTAVNSGTDSDHDGVDDVCDPYIGAPPATNNGGSSGGSIPPGVISGTPPQTGPAATLTAHASAPTGHAPIQTIGSVVERLHLGQLGPQRSAKSLPSVSTPVRFKLQALKVIDWLKLVAGVMALWLLALALLAYRRLTLRSRQLV